MGILLCNVSCKNFLNAFICFHQVTWIITFLISIRNLSMKSFPTYRHTAFSSFLLAKLTYAHTYV